MSSGIPDLSQLGGQGGQLVQITPFVIELNGGIQVKRQPDGSREMLIVHQSGVIAARLTLDPIAAAQIARELSGPAPAEQNGSGQ